MLFMLATAQQRLTIFHRRTHCLDSFRRAISTQVLLRYQSSITLSACSAISIGYRPGFSAYFYNSSTNTTNGAGFCYYQYEHSIDFQGVGTPSTTWNQPWFCGPSISLFFPHHAYSTPGASPSDANLHHVFRSLALAHRG